MKKYHLIPSRNNKKQQLPRQPIQLADIIYLDWWNDVDDNHTWHEKARRLQARRWRKIKQQLV